MFDAVLRGVRVLDSGAPGSPSFPAPGYTGPGDIVAGAFLWSGLRAYSNASMGTNAVRLRRDSDQVEQDFVTLSPSGALDVASITSFKGAANLFVTKLYDQTGNSRDLTQATAANQPPFSLSVIGSLPAIDTTVTPGIMSTAALTLATPFTYSTVANSTNNFGVLFENSISGLSQLRHSPGANTWALVGSSGLSATAADGAWHAAQGIFNGASSDLFLDGVSNTGNTGTAGFSAEVANFLAAGVGSVTWLGFTGEFGVWPIAFTAGNETAMNSNQHAFWNF